MTPFILAFALVPAPSADASVESRLEYARNEYQQGLDQRHDRARAQIRFAAAARAYEDAWVRGPKTAALAQNMAQAHLLAGDIGRSIGAYRRGLAVAPHDMDLLHGLQAVRDQVAYPLTGDLAAHARPPMLTSPLVGWAPWRIFLCLSAAYLGGWLLLIRAWLRGGLSRWLGGTGLVVGAIGVGIWLRVDSMQATRSWATPTAITIGAGAELHTGNSVEYPRRLDGRLPAGVEMRVLAERGQWLQVELTGGIVGWIPMESVVEFR